MEKENEAIQKQLDCMKQAMDEEDEEVSLKIRQSKINSRLVAGPIGQMNRRPSV